MIQSDNKEQIAIRVDEIQGEIISQNGNDNDNDNASVLVQKCD